LSHQTILVLDFGSQFTQLIARRLRELSVYSEILPFSTPIDVIRAKQPVGVILSGGPIRYASAAERAALIATVLADRGGARSVLLDAEVRYDSRYVLAAAGLLATDFPDAARGLIRAGGLLG